MPTSTTGRLHSRPENPSDAAFVRALFNDARSGEFAAAGLAGDALASLLDLQFRAQTVGYATAHPAATGTVVELDGRPAGRAIVARSEQVILIVNIAVLSAYRGRGAASELLRALTREADASGHEIRLQVRTGNTVARALYERFGFATVDERDGDALMSRPSTTTRATREAGANG